MKSFICPQDSQFLSYGELLAHGKALSAEEMKKPVMCQLEGEDDSFPIVKFDKIEDSRIHLVAGTHAPNDSRKWMTWSDLTDYLSSLEDYQLDWFVYVADKSNHYMINDINKTKYPMGFVSNGTVDFNILIIDLESFMDQ